MLPSGAHLDPRFKAFPNLREDEYESILAVPILAREVLEGALNVRTREPRDFTDAEIGLLTSIASQVGQSIEHAKLYAQARRRVDELEALARISEAVSESLYLEESLEAIVRTTVESLGATGAALVLEDGRIAWPEGRAGAHAVRLPLRWRGRGIGELVVDRDTPFSEDDRQLLDAIASQAAVALEHGRMALRGVLAQEIHHRVKNNLQTVASLLRLQARAEGVDPRKALGDSVNRILAIAAVHEELTEHREDVVDLAELVDRLRATLVQGLVAGKEVTAELEPVELAGQRATALALVFSELLSNALEHGGDHVAITLCTDGGEIVLAISDDGPGTDDAVDGTGMSIVRALVRDELGGTLALSDGPGLRADPRLNDRALPWQHCCTEANSMRHSEPSPAIHNVEMPGLTPSLDHVESDPNRRSVALPLLLPGTFVILHTRNTCYRLVVIDGAERRVQINGGKLFPENTDVEVIGAIDDEGVKVGWIVQGFQLELLSERGPVLTSSVESVDVE